MSKPEIVPLHTKWPTFDNRVREALERKMRPGEVTYTRDEVMRVMGEAVLAEREANAQVADTWGKGSAGSPAAIARVIRARIGL